jgi:SAM-dependent methyltransferase
MLIILATTLNVTRRLTEHHTSFAASGLSKSKVVSTCGANNARTSSPGTMDHLDKLRACLDREAHDRRDRSAQGWNPVERGRFCAMLGSPPSGRLLELGAGPGRDGEFFANLGLDVMCVDLSPQMVKCCTDRGLSARVLDFTHGLDFVAESFDAVYAMNSLLHVPKTQIHGVLDDVSRVLRRGGVFFLGVYGGEDFEGEWEQDPTGQRRFFSYFTDDMLQAAVSRHFEVVHFERVASGRSPRLHFQSFHLRKP